ncbi:hypothetical protein EI555_018363, partial [Monodon monoceros]
KGGEPLQFWRNSETQSLDPGSTPHRQAEELRFAACCGPQAPSTRLPRCHGVQEEGQLCRGAEKEEPKRRPAMLGNEAKKVEGKDKSSGKNVQTKGKREQRENRLKWLTKRLKKTYLQKTEKIKMRRGQPLMKQERKKPSLINIKHPVLSVVPVSLLVQSRGIFLPTIV